MTDINETIERMVESSEIVINILADDNLTDEQKRELIDALVIES